MSIRTWQAFVKYLLFVRFLGAVGVSVREALSLNQYICSSTVKKG